MEVCVSYTTKVMWLTSFTATTTTTTTTLRGWGWNLRFYVKRACNSRRNLNNNFFWFNFNRSRCFIRSVKKLQYITR